MKKFSLLKKNDQVSIIAPGYGGTVEDLEKAVGFIKALGLIPHFPADIFGPDLFCSNNDEYRTNHLIDVLINPKINAIWAFRGGYGTSRVIEALKKIKPPKMPKLVIGYSDITVLHLFLNQHWKWPTLHAPVLSNIVERVDEQSRAELRKIIFGEQRVAVFDNLVPLNITANRRLNIESSVTGGNMSLVQNSIGTDWEIVTKNKIIFLEDIGEKAYRIDRSLNQFSQAGIFHKAKALVFGQFIEDETQEKIMPTLERFAHSLKIPVLYCDKIGHGKTNMPLPMGTKAQLSNLENGSWKLEVEI